jgi:hypothetical protein
MNEIDLRRFDLNLLVVFDVLMTERSVTRAAERLGAPSRPSAIRCRGCASSSAIPCWSRVVCGCSRLRWRLT